MHGISPPEVVCNGKSKRSQHDFNKAPERYDTSEITPGIPGGGKTTSNAQKLGYFRPPLIPALFLTCESSQFDTAGHVVIEEDPPSFVVAFDDGVQSLRTDTVAWKTKKVRVTEPFFSYFNILSCEAVGEKSNFTQL